VPRTLKNSDGSAFPISQVVVANPPRGKVNPHHPILNGNVLLQAIDAIAKKSQTSPKDHKMRAMRNPTVKKADSDPSSRVCV
jgi:hypothetical protein